MGSIKHRKTSTIPNAQDDTRRIGGDDWNNEHEIDLEVADIDGLEARLIPLDQVVEYRDDALAYRNEAGQSASEAAVSESNAAATLAAAVKTADINTPSTVAIGGHSAADTQNALDSARTVPSYAALRAYTGPATGMRVATRGVAGTFQRDPSDTTSADTGFDVIVDALGRRWIRLDSEVNPQKFGATGDGIADDSDAVQAFFDFLALKNFGTVDFNGTFRVTKKISLISPLTLNIRCNATIVAAFTAEDEVMLIQGAPALNTPGKLVIQCSGGTGWSSRTNGHGLRIQSSGRANLDYVEIRYSKYDGVVFDGTGNSSLSSINLLRTQYCGSGQGAQGKTVNFTARADSGSVGSTGQRTVLTLDEAPALLNFAKFVRINGYPYAITARDLGASTITVYPWVESTVLTGAVNIIGGAGLHASGGDNSMLNVEAFDAFVCGIGYQGDMLYPGRIGTFTSQLCGVAHTLGVAPSGGCVGGGVDTAYFENNYFDVVLCTSAQLSYKIESAGTITLAKCFRLAPRLAADVPHPSYTGFLGVSIGYQGRKLASPMYAIPGSTTLGASVLPSPICMANMNTSNTPNILLFGPTTGAAYPYQDLYFMTTGTGPNNAPTGTVTLTPEAGYGINGGAVGVPVTYTGLSGATLWHAYVSGTNWRVSRVGFGETFSGSATYDPPSLATGAQATTTVTVTGVAAGDLIEAVSFGLPLQGLMVTASVDSANTVSVTFLNMTGGTVNLGSGTLRVRARKA